MDILKKLRKNKGITQAMTLAKRVAKQKSTLKKQQKE